MTLAGDREAATMSPFSPTRPAPGAGSDVAHFSVSFSAPTFRGLRFADWEQAAAWHSRISPAAAESSAISVTIRSRWRRLPVHSR